MRETFTPVLRGTRSRPILPHGECPAHMDSFKNMH